MKGVERKEWLVIERQQETSRKRVFRDGEREQEKETEN